MKTQLRKPVLVGCRGILAMLFVLQHFGDAFAGKPVGTIVPTGNTTVPRFDHTATLLAAGNVLIVGGMERNGVTDASAELYDPATGRFTPAAKMKGQRGWGSTATRLANGEVLIAGGATGSLCSPDCHLASAELYDPATGSFKVTGSMKEPRAGGFAILLPTGDVLMVGGTMTSGKDSQASAELYHPATGTFTSAGSMVRSKGVSAALLLKSGKVLVIGRTPGEGVIEEAIAEIYDPSTGQFTPTGKMKTPRAKVGIGLLSDGRVLVVGGQIQDAWGPWLDSTEIYDPASGSFSRGPEMNFKRFKLPKAVVPLSNGQILIAGGADRPEIYDPASHQFVLTKGSNLDGFYFSTATVLRTGEVLIVGGYGPHGTGTVNHAWLYRP